MTERVVSDDADALADTVARRFLDLLVTAQRRGGAPQVALTGGTIAERIHGRVAALAADSPVDWSQVVFWWGDERFVSPESEDRNAVQARASLLGRVGATQVHEIPSTAQARDVDEAADLYAATLRRHGSGAFDLVMLGIGPDGHVASLFPGRSHLDVTNRVAVGVTDSPKPPPHRVSLTFPALNRARLVWFVASGAGKADAVRRATAEEGTVSQTPARGIVPAASGAGSSPITWFLDRAAAEG